MLYKILLKETIHPKQIFVFFFLNLQFIIFVPVFRFFFLKYSETKVKRNSYKAGSLSGPIGLKKKTANCLKQLKKTHVLYLRIFWQPYRKVSRALIMIYINFYILTKINYLYKSSVGTIAIVSIVDLEILIWHFEPILQRTRN